MFVLSNSLTTKEDGMGLWVGGGGGLDKNKMTVMLLFLSLNRLLSSYYRTINLKYFLFFELSYSVFIKIV